MRVLPGTSAVRPPTRSGHNAGELHAKYLAWARERFRGYAAPGLTWAQYLALIEANPAVFARALDTLLGGLACTEVEFLPDPVTNPAGLPETWKPMQRLLANAAAYRTVRTLQIDERAATPAEVEQMRGFSGWGGLAAASNPLIAKLPLDPEAFDPPTLEAIRQFRGSVGPGARPVVSTVFAEADNQYYTPISAVEVIWQVVAEVVSALGKPPIRTALEPSAGSGRMIQAISGQPSTPLAWPATSVLWDLVERDPYPAAMLQAIYDRDRGGPNAQHLVYPAAAFETFAFQAAKAKRGYDLIVANPPYPERPAYERAEDPVFQSWERADAYFAARLVSLLNPGGVLVLLTPISMISGAPSNDGVWPSAGGDNDQARIRALLARDLHLYAAMALPTRLFPSARLNLALHVWVKPPAGETVHSATSHGNNSVKTNQFWRDFPEAVLGTWVNGQRYNQREVDLAAGTTLAGIHDQAPRFAPPAGWAEAIAAARAAEAPPEFTRLPVKVRDLRAGHTSTLRKVRAPLGIQDFGSIVGAGPIPWARALDARIGHYLDLAKDDPIKAFLLRRELLLDVQEWIATNGNPHKTLLDTSTPGAKAEHAKGVSLLLGVVSPQGEIHDVLAKGPKSEQEARLVETALPLGSGDPALVIGYYSTRYGVCTVGDLFRHGIDEANATSTVVADPALAILFNSEGGVDGYCTISVYLSGDVASKRSNALRIVEGAVASDAVRTKASAQLNRLDDTAQRDPVDLIEFSVRSGYVTEQMLTGFARHWVFLRNAQGERRIPSGGSDQFDIVRGPDGKFIFRPGPNGEHPCGQVLGVKFVRTYGNDKELAEMTAARLDVLLALVNNFSQIPRLMGFSGDDFIKTESGVVVGTKGRMINSVATHNLYMGIDSYRASRDKDENEASKWEARSGRTAGMDALLHSMDEQAEGDEADDQDQNRRGPTQIDLATRNQRIAALNAQFAEWIRTQPALAQEYADAYNDAYHGFRRVRYNEDPVDIARLSPHMVLRPYQNSTVRRLAAQGSLMVTLDVGLGKTLSALSGIALRRQEGTIRRPLVVVPNKVALNWMREVRKAYPNYRVQVIGWTFDGNKPVSVGAAARAAQWDALAAFDLTIVPYSKFKMDVGVRDETAEAIYLDFITSTGAAGGTNAGDRYRLRTLISSRELWQAEANGLQDTADRVEALTAERDAAQAAVIEQIKAATSGAQGRRSYEGRVEEPTYYLIRDAAVRAEVQSAITAHHEKVSKVWAPEINKGRTAANRLKALRVEIERADTLIAALQTKLGSVGGKQEAGDDGPAGDGSELLTAFRKDRPYRLRTKKAQWSEDMDYAALEKACEAGGLDLDGTETQDELVAMLMDSFPDGEIPDRVFDPIRWWEDLKVDYLVVDEAHNFKNLFFPNQLGTIEMLGVGQPSVQANDLWFKAQYLLRQPDTRGGVRDEGVVLLTATPLKNSPFEAYNLLWYLSSSLWGRTGVGDAIGFLQTFLQIADKMQIKQGGGLEFVQTVESFQRADVLRNVLAQYEERRTAKDLENYYKTTGQEEVYRKDFPKGVERRVIVEPDPVQARILGLIRGALASGVPVDTTTGVALSKEQIRENRIAAALTAESQGFALDPYLIGGPLDEGDERDQSTAFLLQELLSKVSQNPNLLTWSLPDVAEAIFDAAADSVLLAQRIYRLSPPDRLVQVTIFSVYVFTLLAQALGCNAGDVRRWLTLVADASVKGGKAPTYRLVDEAQYLRAVKKAKVDASGTLVVQRAGKPPEVVIRRYPQDDRLGQAPDSSFYSIEPGTHSAFSWIKEFLPQIRLLGAGVDKVLETLGAAPHGQGQIHAKTLTAALVQAGVLDQTDAQVFYETVLENTRVLADDTHLNAAVYDAAARRKKKGEAGGEAAALATAIRAYERAATNLAYQIRRYGCLRWLQVSQVPREYGASFPSKHQQLVAAIKERTTRQNLVDGTMTSCGHVVFSDNNANIDHIVRCLVHYGIPRNKIGVITAREGTAKNQQTALALTGVPADPVTGAAAIPPSIDVVIGNTGSMGEGVNLQTRTCAVHHMDLTWEPASIHQRNGRAVRQGNHLGQVDVIFYLLAGSFDSLQLNKILGKKSWQDSLYEEGVSDVTLGADEASREELILSIVLADNPALLALAVQAIAGRIAAEQARREYRTVAKTLRDFSVWHAANRAESTARTQSSLRELGNRLLGYKFFGSHITPLVTRSLENPSEPLPVFHPITGLMLPAGTYRIDPKPGLGPLASSGAKLIASSLGVTEDAALMHDLGLRIVSDAVDDGMGSGRTLQIVDTMPWEWPDWQGCVVRCSGALHSTSARLRDAIVGLGPGSEVNTPTGAEVSAAFRSQHFVFTRVEDETLDDRLTAWADNRLGSKAGSVPSGTDYSMIGSARDLVGRAAGYFLFGSTDERKNARRALMAADADVLHHLGVNALSWLWEQTVRVNPDEYRALLAVPLLRRESRANPVTETNPICADNGSLLPVSWFPRGEPHSGVTSAPLVLVSKADAAALIAAGYWDYAERDATSTTGGYLRTQVLKRFQEATGRAGPTMYVVFAPNIIATGSSDRFIPYTVMHGLFRKRHGPNGEKHFWEYADPGNITGFVAAGSDVEEAAVASLVQTYTVLPKPIWGGFGRILEEDALRVLRYNATTERIEPVRLTEGLYDIWAHTYNSNVPTARQVPDGFARAVNWGAGDLTALIQSLAVQAFGSVSGMLYAARGEGRLLLGEETEVPKAVRDDFREAEKLRRAQREATPFPTTSGVGPNLFLHGKS